LCAFSKHTLPFHILGLYSLYAKTKKSQVRKEGKKRGRQIETRSCVKMVDFSADNEKEIEQI